MIGSASSLTLESKTWEAQPADWPAQPSPGTKVTGNPTNQGLRAGGACARMVTNIMNKVVLLVLRQQMGLGTHVELLESN